MRTLKVVSYGEYQWNGPGHAARIERARVFYSWDDKAREVLKFCYLKGGRHARTHLTIKQDDFVELFRSAVENKVFDPGVINRMRRILR